MSEWDQRRLCPDGGCIGVIGESGTCSVCGTRAAEARSEDAQRATDFDEDDEYYYEDDDDSDGDDADDGDDDDEADETEPAADAPGWTDRALCPDGGCVGVIGDNGLCKVCGRKGE